MPRYFIDTPDGQRPLIDNSGQEFPGAEAARRAALDALPDMARDELPNGDRRTFAVSVRDASCRAIYSAKLMLEGHWHAGHSAAEVGAAARDAPDRRPRRSMEQWHDLVVENRAQFLVPGNAHRARCAALMMEQRGLRPEFVKQHCGQSLRSETCLRRWT